MDKYIAKTSYDVMWDWDIASGEVYVGDSIEEVFGYKLQNNRINFPDFISILLPDEKNQVEKKLSQTLDSPGKHWKDAFLLKRHDGSVATTTSRASIVRDEAGKAIRLIGATQDVSKLQELEMKLEEQLSIKEEQRQFLTSKLSHEVIWDWNLLTNEVFIGDEFEKLFGYALTNNNGKICDKINHLHPDDQTDFDRELQVAVASSVTQWEHAYRFIRADGTIAKVVDRATIIRQPGGKAYRMLGTMQDISRQKELQEKTDGQTSNEKKKQIIEKIKNVIIALVCNSDERLNSNLSDYLSKQLAYNYTYLANVFSEMEGSTIQKFIISKKIESVKELLIKGDLSLTEIAWKLHYSSVAHLSNQFKKLTGVTPTSYKARYS